MLLVFSSADAGIANIDAAIAVIVMALTIFFMFLFMCVPPFHDKTKQNSIPLFAIRIRIIFPSSSQKNSISFGFCFVICHIFIVLKLRRNHDYEFFTIISHFSQNVLFNYIISTLFYKTLLFKCKICVFVFLTT